MLLFVHELRLFFIALQFLTRVPVPGWVGFKPEWLHASARHFAGVGLLVGSVAAAVLWALAHTWPALVSVLLSVAFTVWITGAFHEDGWADTCDALGGAVSRERALEIMKDSRLGTYGTVALVGMLAIKVAAVHALLTRDLTVALVVLPLAHTWSRGATVLLLRVLRYGGDVEHAKAKPMAQQVDAYGFAVAMLWCALAAAVALLFLPAAAVALAAAAVLLAAGVMARWLHKRLGGYTGDGLGATQQVCELVTYLAVLAVVARGL
jgi:adenosylcobinamide-GDP ribazoletransferase